MFVVCSGGLHHGKPGRFEKFMMISGTSHWQTLRRSFLALFPFFWLTFSSSCSSSVPVAQVHTLYREEISSSRVGELLVSSYPSALSLSGCSMDTTDLIQVLRHALGEQSPLTSFTLRQCALDDELFRLALIRNVSLPLNGHLSHLDLSYNPLTEKGVKHLASIVTRLPQLQSLRLDGIRLTSDGVRALAHALRRHPSLEYISLVSCSLSDECLELISVLVKSHTRIRSLHLGHNKFSASGLSSLLEVVRAGAAKSLESLDVSYNALGDLGVLSLARALEISQLPRYNQYTRMHENMHYFSATITPPVHYADIALLGTTRNSLSDCENYC